MPDTVDRYAVCTTICARLASLANNIRSESQFIKNCFTGTVAGSPMFNDLAATQAAFRGLGTALDSVNGISGLWKIDQIVTGNGAAISAGLTAIGVAPADATNRRTALRTSINNLKGATLASSADVDTLVNGILAAIPDSLQTT
jgi:hypothetical protein